MSTSGPAREQPLPLIALVHQAHRELQGDMVRQARAAGYTHARLGHNWVFGTLPAQGARTAELAARAGITRQSMGEIVRELVELGVVEMTPDPHDRRAKLVTYTEAGRRQVQDGMAHVAAFDVRMADALGADGYEQLQRGLRTIVEVLRSESRDGVGAPD